MANKLQKFIYNLSAVAPMGIVFSALLYAEKGKSLLCLVGGCVSLIIIIYEFVFIFLSKKRFPPIIQGFKDVSNNDKLVISYVITYLLPFSSLVVDSINWKLIFPICFVAALIMAFSNFTIPNPMLFLAGYHFYSAKTDNGAQSIVIISKRADYRSADEIKKCRRIFEDLVVCLED